MSGPTPIGPFTFRLGEAFQAAPGKTPPDLAAALGSTNQGRGVIVATRAGLAVRIANMNLPLPASATMATGTPVQITLLQGEQGVQVQVRPESVAPEAPRASTTRPLVASVLQTLGAMSPANLNAASTILPSGIHLSEATVRMLLTLFVSRGESGRDLAAVGTHIRAALSAGALPPDWANTVLSLLDEASASDDRQFRAALEKALQRARSPVEARIAHALARGDSDPATALQGDLRAQLLQLRENAALTKFLTGKGDLTAFRQAADGVIERLTGTHLQNTHGIDHTYYFLELPMNPNAQMNSAQVHFFLDGRSTQAGGHSEDATVVMDLNTRHLGDLWISLRTQNNACTCRFRVVQEESVAAIRNAEADIKAALLGTGFQHVDIRITEWDGDRLGAVSGLMGRLAGLDTTA